VRLIPPLVIRVADMILSLGLGLAIGILVGRCSVTCPEPDPCPVAPIVDVGQDLAPVAVELWPCQ